MDPMLLQKQLKENNSDLENFYKELKTWGEEIKLKEDPPNLNSKAKLRKTEKPNSKNKVQKEHPQQSIPTTKAYTNYAKWNQFDADAECEKLDNSDSELSDEFDDSLKDEALFQKDKGNKFVKNQKWDEAIECYTKAISLFAYDPIFYANRALCYIRKNRMSDAEHDCNMSLSLDNTYVKAFQRRAVARQALNKFKESEQDLLQVLKFEPKNSEAKAALAKLGAILNNSKHLKRTEDQRPLSKFTASRNLKQCLKSETIGVSKYNTSLLQNSSTGDSLTINNEVDHNKPNSVWPEIDDILMLKPINKPPHLKSKTPLHHVEITDKLNRSETLHELNEQDYISSTSWPQTNEQSMTIRSDDFKVIEKKEPEDSKVLKIGFNMKVNDEKKLVKKIETMTPPKTSVQFYSMWKHFGKSDLKYQYLQLIKPVEIPIIFKDSLESDIFSDILKIFAEYSLQFNEKVYDYLLNLTKVKRFSTFTMFMTLADKNCLWKLFNFMKQNNNVIKEDLEDLIKKYEL